MEEVKVEASKPAVPSTVGQDAKTDVSDSLTSSALAALQSDVQPVGHDYVEEASLGRSVQLEPTYTYRAEMHLNIKCNM